jgi:hypothetical protein
MNGKHGRWWELTCLAAGDIEYILEFILEYIPFK